MHPEIALIQHLVANGVAGKSLRRVHRVLEADVLRLRGIRGDSQPSPQEVLYYGHRPPVVPALQSRSVDPAGGRATGCRGEDEGTFARGPGFAHKRMGQAEVDGRFHRYVSTEN